MRHFLCFFLAFILSCAQQTVSLEPCCDAIKKLSECDVDIPSFECSDDCYNLCLANNTCEDISLGYVGANTPFSRCLASCSAKI